MWFTRVWLAGAICCVISSAAQPAFAQDMPTLPDFSPKSAAAGPLPEYDVASVKLNKSGGGMMRIMSTPDGFNTTNLTLKNMIANAYGIKTDLISGGPAWLDSARFDVNAKVAGADVAQYQKLNQEQRRKMSQVLLADRFKVKVHREVKELPIYELVIAKGGSKLKESAPVAPAVSDAEGPVPKMQGRITMGPGLLSGNSLETSTLASQLSSALHRTVIDKTGLTGRYDFDLKYAPEAAAPAGDATADAGPSIFTAVQEQLGLRLQSSKGPVETLVVDSVEMPEEN